MHEGIHGTLFRRRGLDHRVGFLLGVPALFSFTAYKVAHLAHHRHTRTAQPDPDDFLNVSPHPAVRSAVFYAWLAVGMLAYLIHVPAGAWRLGRPEDRRAIGLEYGLMLALRGGHRPGGEPGPARCGRAWLADPAGRGDRLRQCPGAGAGRS